MNVAINQTEQYKENVHVKGTYKGHEGYGKNVKDNASAPDSFSLG